MRCYHCHLDGASPSPSCDECGTFILRPHLPACRCLPTYLMTSDLSSLARACDYICICMRRIVRLGGAFHGSHTFTHSQDVGGAYCSSNATCAYTAHGIGLISSLGKYPLRNDGFQFHHTELNDLIRILPLR